jgi:ankyrin repeat protein
MLRPVVLSLILAGVSVNVLVGASGDKRLVEAAQNQDKESIRSLLKEHADVNQPDVEGMTPLLWAVHWDDLETVRLLIGSGANVRASTRLGVTALAEAARISSADMIDALLNGGADPNATIGAGDTPLMWVARTGNVAAAKSLLAHGANVNAKETYRGQTALMWALAEDHAEMVKLLIEAGADVNSRATIYEAGARRGLGDTAMGGLTPLLLAARQGAVESGKLLIAAGANVNAAEPEYDLSSMALAVVNDHYDFAGLMANSRAALNDGSLYTAVEMRDLPSYGNRPRPPRPDKLDNLGFIKLLLDRGADPNGILVTRTGQLPPRGATGNVVVPAGATPFWRAARSSDVPMMQLLLKYGADPKITTKDHNTAIIAAATGREQVTFQAGVESISEDDTIEAIKMLLGLGLDINAASERGDTAMHGAGLLGTNKVVRFLADHGARLDVKNKAGQTPEDMAMTIINTNGGETHPKTAALIRQLMVSRPAKNTP